MKFIGFAFFMLMLCQAAFPQSKKDQIETLILQIDSLGKILTKERILYSDKIKDLETKIINIHLEVELLQTELNQSNKDLASKELEISRNQLDQFSQEKIIRGLGSELNQIKSSLVSISDQVKIGNQIWMKKNLNVDKFRNGDPIPQAKTAEEWINAGRAGQPAWSYYDNDPSNYELLNEIPLNGEKYGKLYNWYAVNDPRGLAPLGWHIPNKEDWETLRENLGGEKLAATKMKSTSGWADDYDISEKGHKIEGTQKNGNGTNESGFSALPSGARRTNGTFVDPTDNASWWSSTSVKNYGVVYFALCSGCNFYDSGSEKDRGYSVRCIKY